MADPAASNHRMENWAIAVGLLVFVAFAPSIAFGLIDYDDRFYLQENMRVLEGLNATNVIWAFTTTHGGLYQPLVWLSFMLDVSVAGNNPHMFHFTNVFLHAATCAWLTWILIRHTGRLHLAVFSALLFGLHPLRAESVAWAVERKDVLSVFFAVGSLWALGAMQPSSKRAPTWLWCSFFGLALLSKPMLVTLPLAYLLYRQWPLSLPWSWPWAWRWTPPLLAVSLAFAGVNLWAAAEHGYLMNAESLPLGERLFAIPGHLLEYVEKTFVPRRLLLIYEWRAGQWSEWALMLALAGAVAVLSLVTLRRSQRAWTVGWLWFALCLMPALGFTQAGAQRIADRFTYWPHLVFVPAMVYSVSYFWDAVWRLKPSVSWTEKILLSLCVVALAALLPANLERFRTAERSYEHILEIEPGNPKARRELASVYYRSGRFQEAFNLLSSLLANGQAEAPQAMLAARSLESLGQVAESARWFEEAVRLAPQDSRGLQGHCTFLARQGLRALGEECWEHWVRQFPGAGGKLKPEQAALKIRLESLPAVCE